MSRTRAAGHLELPQPWADVPLTVVMPTYNEAGALAGTCERVLSLPLPRLHLRSLSPAHRSRTQLRSPRLSVRLRPLPVLRPHPPRRHPRAGRQGCWLVSSWCCSS